LIHERRIRLVRDRDLFDQRVLLQLPVRRVDCLNCGRVTERIDWLEPASRLTRRLQVWLESLLRLLPISHVSQLTGLHWHTLKTLDKRRLQAEVGTFYSSGVRRLVMDEFALHKGHRYATVIMGTPSEHGCCGSATATAVRRSARSLNCSASTASRLRRWPWT